MKDTPRKKLSIKRKPKPAEATSAEPSDDTAATSPGRSVRRPAKRRVIRNDAAKKPKPAAAIAKAKKRPPRKNKKKALVSPSDLKAQALDERLKAYDVWSTYKPLTKGIDKTLFQLVNDEAFPGASKKVIQKLLRKHTNHARYLQAMSRGGVRYHLDGKPAETISEYQQQLAVNTQAKRAGRVLPK